MGPRLPLEGSAYARGELSHSSRSRHAQAYGRTSDKPRRTNSQILRLASGVCHPRPVGARAMRLGPEAVRRKPTLAGLLRSYCTWLLLPGSRRRTPDIGVSHQPSMVSSVAEHPAQQPGPRNGHAPQKGVMRPRSAAATGSARTAPEQGRDDRTTASRPAPRLHPGRAMPPRRPNRPARWPRLGGAAGRVPLRPPPLPTAPTARRSALLTTTCQRPRARALSACECRTTRSAAGAAWGDILPARRRHGGPGLLQRMVRHGTAFRG